MFFLICFLFLFCHAYSYLTTYHDISLRNTSFIASVAIDNDCNTIWSNPSNIGHIDQLQLSFTYGLLLFGLRGSDYLKQVDNVDYEPGINENIFSVGIPLKKYGYTGFGVYRLSLGQFFNENLFLITYGKNISKKFSAGGSIKIFHREYGKDIYTQHYEIFRTKGYSKTAFTIDISITYKILENVNCALVVHNITRPNLSLSNSKEDQYPVTGRAGLGINIDKYKFGIEVNYDIITETTRNTKFFTSVEYSLLEKLYLDSSLGVGENNYYDFAFGFRINVVKNILIGYTLKYPLSGLKNVLTHKASIDLLFSPYKKKEAEILQKQKEEQKITTEEQQSKKGKLRIKSSVIKKLKRIFSK